MRALACVLGLICTYPTFADEQSEAARQAVSAALGHDVTADGSFVVRCDTLGGIGFGTVTCVVLTEADGARVTHWVDGATGQYSGFGVADLLWHTWYPAHPVGEDKAKAAAIACAKRFLGADAPAEWLVWHEANDRFTLLGRQAVGGSPPVYGVRPECLVVVMRDGAKVARYQQYVPVDSPTPKTPELSADAAVEAAKAHGRMSYKDCEPELVEPPYLYQGHSHLSWCVLLGVTSPGPAWKGYGPRTMLVRVDAKTGYAEPELDHLRLGSWGVAMSTVARTALPASALTLEEADAVVERAAGAKLGDPTIRSMGAHEGVSDLTAEYRQVQGGRTWTYRVDLARGRLGYWALDDADSLPSGPPALTPEQGLELAKNTARVTLGDLVDRMTWAIGGWNSERGGVRGEGAPIGDPPREGLAPACSITVHVPTGLVTQCFQWVWPHDEAVVPRLTAEDAARCGARAVGAARLEPLEQPRLRQWHGKLTWEFKTGATLFSVDAVTGDVDADEPSGGVEALPPQDWPDKIDTGEARALAERLLGAPCDPGEPQVIEVHGVRQFPRSRLAFFEGQADAGERYRVAVNLTGGTIVGMRAKQALRAPEEPVRSAPLTEQSAVAAVRAVAERGLGKDASALPWRTRDDPVAWVSYDGVTWRRASNAPPAIQVIGSDPSRDDPPSYGQGAQCVGWVSKASGRLVLYIQSIGPRAPLSSKRPALQVSAAMAKNLARRSRHAVWPDGAEVVCPTEPYLVYPGFGSPAWVVNVQVARTDEALSAWRPTARCDRLYDRVQCRVDAVTGHVESDDAPPPWPSELPGELADDRTLPAVLGLPDAKAAVEAETGASLAGCVASITAPRGRSPRGRFAMDGPSGEYITYEADLETADWTGLNVRSGRYAPAGDSMVSGRAAVRSAINLAKQYLGSSVDDLGWWVEGRSSGCMTVLAEGPLVGDPPRHGLSASAAAQVSVVDGSVLSFYYTPASGEAPVVVTISSDGAVRAALEAHSGYELSGLPELWQEGQRATWRVTLVSPGAEGVAKTVVAGVDALTGMCSGDISVIASGEDTSEAVYASTLGAGAPTAAGDSSGVWRVAAPCTAAVLVAGYLLLRRRRRRPQ